MQGKNPDFARVELQRDAYEGKHVLKLAIEHEDKAQQVKIGGTADSPCLPNNPKDKAMMSNDNMMSTSDVPEDTKRPLDSDIWMCLFRVNRIRSVLFIRPKLTAQGGGGVVNEHAGFIGLGDDDALMEDDSAAVAAALAKADGNGKAAVTEGAKAEGKVEGKVEAKEEPKAETKATEEPKTEAKPEDKTTEEPKAKEEPKAATTPPDPPVSARTRHKREQSKEALQPTKPVEELGNLELSKCSIIIVPQWREYMRDVGLLILGPGTPYRDALVDAISYCNDLKVIGKKSNVRLYWEPQTGKSQLQSEYATPYNPVNAIARRTAHDLPINLLEWAESFSLFMEGHEVRVLLGFERRMVGGEIELFVAALRKLKLDFGEMLRQTQARFTPGAEPLSPQWTLAQLAYAANKLLRAIVLAHIKDPDQLVVYGKFIADKDRAEYAGAFGEEAAAKEWAFGEVDPALGEWMFVPFAVRLPVSRKRAVPEGGEGQGGSKDVKTQ